MLDFGAPAVVSFEDNRALLVGDEAKFDGPASESLLSRSIHVFGDE